MFSISKFSMIVWSLAAYAVIAGILSICQLDYVSADFIAYVTIARRTIEQPLCAITAYWSSLFAWTMTPLLYAGINDLIAGRLVLLVSGGFYLLAIHRLTVIHSKGRQPSDTLIQIGTMTCSVIHASIWANYLLAPDLLANAVLYYYFCLVSDRGLTEYRPRRAFSAGLVAGAAYLAKAYMLPFCSLHIVLTVMFDLFPKIKLPSASRRIKTALQMLALFGLGLSLVTGPWIACLSWKCGRPTFSTAGSANHANMSPENFRKDPLWNPGLTPDFIFEPHLAPDWSAFQNLAHFQHQLSIVTYNVLNCIGLIPIWLTVFGVGVFCVTLLKHKLDGAEISYLCWVSMTVLVYCGGYTVVNLEARYIIPTVVPLLCHASLIMLRQILAIQPTFMEEEETSIPSDWSLLELKTIGTCSSRLAHWCRLRPSAFVIAFVLFLCSVDIHNMIRVATIHPQSTKLDKFRIVADQLSTSTVEDTPCACSDWHFGLYIAYAANRLTNYWGTPLARSKKQALDELEATNVRVYFRFVSDSDDSSRSARENPVGENRSWRRTLTIRRPEFAPKFLEVYERR
jgi:hypothetical protein